MDLLVNSFDQGLMGPKHVLMASQASDLLLIQILPKQKSNVQDFLIGEEGHMGRFAQEYD